MQSLLTTAEFVAEHEGLRLSAYLDSRQNVTVGFGIALTAPNGLALDEAEFLLCYRLYKLLADCRRFPGFDELSPARQAILADCAYNMGIGNFEREIASSLSGNALMVAHAIGSCAASKINPGRYATNALDYADDILSKSWPDPIIISDTIKAFVHDVG